MLISYLTLDEVNQQVAREIAQACRVILHLLTLDDASARSVRDPVVYDLDYLPPERRQQILAELLSDSPHGIVAVHSYNLADRQIARLRRNGVAVFRRLERRVFRRLKSAVLQRARAVAAARAASLKALR